MIRPIMHDPFFLAQKSEPATEADRQVITDLMDTLRANLNRCVGMAANMIGEKKRIIVFCNGPMQMVMVNPQITANSGEYETEEGCLSLAGVRKTKRYRKITVAYQDQTFHNRTASFDGFTAQIIQHEIDHCDGKAPKGEHQRKTTVIFDPEQQEKREFNITVRHKKRVAAYARVSTEQDAQQNSYAAQIEYYRGYIQSKPEWEYAGVYADEGVTGTSYKKRDGFNRMIEDAENGKIDLILTKSISRFARNTVDSLTITRKLKAAGVEVYFEKENISSMDVQAELIFTIMSSIAQEESRSISENVRWGQIRSMEAGKISLAWRSFLGYEKGPDGLPHIVEEEAELVRKIYRLFLEGKSINNIAEQLTREGHKTPMDADHWYPTTVRSILSNEKYRGDARLQKTYTVDFLTKEVRVNNGERKQWYIHDGYEREFLPLIGDTAGLKQKLSALTEELNGQIAQIERLVLENAQKAQDQAVYTEKFSALNKSIEQKKALIQGIEQQISEALIKKENARIFMEGLRSTESGTILTRFDIRLWHSLVDYATVMPVKTIIFHFRNGNEETVKLEEVK